MKKEISFLRSRAEALASAISANGGDGFRQTWMTILAQVEATEPNISTSALEKMEREMDLFPRTVLGKTGMKVIEDRLLKAHGFRSLGTSPQKIARKVLKRGSISGDDERQVLQDYLSEDSSRTELTDREARTLDRLLG